MQGYRTNTKYTGSLVIIILDMVEARSVSVENIQKTAQELNCSRREGRNGGNLGGKRKKRSRQERVGSVAADPDNQENTKEAGGEAQGTQGFSKDRIRRESMSPFCRV